MTGNALDRPVLIKVIGPAVMLYMIKCYGAEFCVFTERNDLGHLWYVSCLGVNGFARIKKYKNNGRQTKDHDKRKYSLLFHSRFPPRNMSSDRAEATT